MDGVGSVGVIVPGPVVGRLSHTSLCEHGGIIGDAVGVQTVGQAQLMALGVLRDFEVGVGDAGGIDHAGGNVIIERADLVDVHREVAAHLENIPYLIGGDQRFQLGEVIIEGVVFILDLDIGVQRLIQLNGGNGFVVAVLRAPPCHAQVDLLIAAGGLGRSGGRGGITCRGSAGGAGAAAGGQTQCHGSGHRGCDQFLFHAVSPCPFYFW